MLRRAVALVLVAGCSKGPESKPSDPEPRGQGATDPAACVAYADRYATLIDPDPSRRGTVRSGALSSCEKARVTAKQIQCVEDASSADDVRACMGVSPAPSGSVAAGGPSPKMAITIAKLEGGGVAADAAAMPERQREWRDKIAASLASSCAMYPPPPMLPASIDAQVTYGNRYPGGADVVLADGAGPEGLVSCIRRQLSTHKPDPAANLAIDVPITVSLTIDMP